jgi:hexosaminidase
MDYYPAPAATVAAIDVCILSDDQTLDVTVNESYSLSVPVGTRGSLQSETVYGALRGLETLAQLGSFHQPGTILNAPIRVELDQPAFPYRGLMVNPSLTYLPVSFLEHIMDSMVMNKLNVLHIHWTDISSFPIVSEIFPQLSGNGSYHPLAVYTKRDLRRVVEYGRLRGIRIIPEFDMPGHGSW